MSTHLAVSPGSMARISTSACLREAFGDVTSVPIDHVVVRDQGHVRSAAALVDKAVGLGQVAGADFDRIAALGEHDFDNCCG